LLSAVVSLVVLLTLAALLGFLADRYGDGSTTIDMAWHLNELQRRYDWGERASEVEAGATRGAAVAAVGGAVATVSFLVVPFLPLPFVGGLTMPAAIDLLDDYEPAIDLLWLVPVSTAVTAFTAFRLWLGADRGARWCRWASAGLATGCVAVLVPLLAVLFLPAMAASWVSTGAAARSATGLLDVGYYLCVLGVAGSLVGSQLVAGQLRTTSRP
jgi:hypothetical protein